MKTYLFNPETGAYLGEYFVDEDEAPIKRGSFVTPPEMTTIAPPEEGRGHKIVFDAVAQRWEVRSHW